MSLPQPSAIVFVVVACIAAVILAAPAAGQQLSDRNARSVAAHAVPAAENSDRVDESDEDPVAELASARHAAERAHLWRVAAWGGVNALGGLALVTGTGRTDQPLWWGFGAQSGLWGVVNVGIATAGLLASGAPETGYDAALSAERTYHDILLFNLGLNVAYSSVGTTLVLLSHRGLSNPRAFRGHGYSLIMQGAGLFILDAIAFLGSRNRLSGLLDVAGSLSGRALPTGFALTWSF